MTKSYKQLRDLILKSEGRTLEDELEFGCRLEAFFSGEKLIMLEDLGQNILCLADDPLNRTVVSSKVYVEILGLPITLERVLGALGKEFVARVEGREEACIFGIMKGEVKWQLNEPLHEQSKETILKLIEILE